VFVHGLNGHPLDTWKKAEVVWPRDLLPVDAPHARIMSFGYDANVVNFFSVASHSSIFQHAQNLLQDLQRERRTPDEVRTYPTMFSRPFLALVHVLLSSS
jgi:hypothetical protein